MFEKSVPSTSGVPVSVLTVSGAPGRRIRLRNTTSSMAALSHQIMRIHRGEAAELGIAQEDVRITCGRGALRQATILVIFWSTQRFCET